MVVRCTKKMLDLLGGRSLTLSELPPTDGDWYLNLLWIDRQKCLLLTHAGTLFSVFRAGVRSPDLRPLGTYLVEAIETELRAESLPTDTFSQLQPDTVQLAKTASRSTLGFMNEMAFELRYLIADAGGLGRCDIDALNHGLRRTLRNAANTSARSNSPPACSTRAPDRNHFGTCAPQVAQQRLGRGRHAAKAHRPQFANPTRYAVVTASVLVSWCAPALRLPWPRRPGADRSRKRRW